MLNRSASLAMSTSVFEALPGKLDIKRHSPSILYICSRGNKQTPFSGQNNNGRIRIKSLNVESSAIDFSIK